MANEAYVQVAADSVGKKIRNLQLEVLQPDGTYATVYMQVASIVDMEGRAADFGAVDTAVLLRALLREMTALRQMYGIATGLGMAALPSSFDDTVG